MNEVVLGAGFGVLLGPHVLNIFDPHTLTQEVMRIVLAVCLFAIGVGLPKTYIAEHAKSLIMVVPTMAFGWVAFIHILFPKLNFVSSLVISACMTPTDPIVSAAVIGGNFAVTNVPLPIQQLLIAESASNDRLAYPFLSISIYLTTEASRATAFEKWIIISWLYQVILRTTLGAIIGHLFSRILRSLQEREFIKRESYIAQYISLALFTAGATNSLRKDDLLAAFAADGHFNQQTEHDSFSADLDLLLNCTSFIYIGAVIGVGAVFIATLAQSHLEVPQDPPQTQEDLLAIALQPMVAFVVLGSILTHGLSIPFFAVGCHSLTISRSVVDTPKWPLRVRRARHQVDAGRPDAPEGADSDDTIILREAPH
ncbi:Sodium/hydrogen exchanger family-domain-containing protein [Lactarius vividus]|nr:Sodium/hydrogen exchanger family-domain-containing protein [Lactarius vividus]